MTASRLTPGGGGRRYDVRDHMIKQTGRGMPSRVQLYGCFWRSLGALVEIETGRAWSLRELRRAYVEMQRIECRVFSPTPEHDGYAMDANCFLYRPGLVFSAWWDMAGFPGRRFVSERSDVRPTEGYWMEQLSTGGPVGTHFRLPDWDPYFPTVDAPVVGYRIMREV